MSVLLLNAPWRGFAIWLGVIAVLAVLPWIPTISAEAFGNAHGCNVNEGVITPCIVDGVDYGQKLHDDFTTVWLAVLSLLPVAIALLVWFILLLQAIGKRLNQ